MILIVPEFLQFIQVMASCGNTWSFYKSPSFPSNRVLIITEFHCSLTSQTCQACQEPMSGTTFQHSGDCTKMACMEHYASCPEYQSSEWHARRAENGSTFWCRVGCNYCNGCGCDGDNYMYPGGECTKLECEEEVSTPVSPFGTGRRRSSARKNLVPPLVNFVLLLQKITHSCYSTSEQSKGL